MTVDDDLGRGISDWITAKVSGAGLSGTVVGLSGGVDSAVVAALCKRAVGERALGVHLPCHSLDADSRDAALVAEALSLETVTIRLDEPFDAIRAALPPGSELAEANLKPRLRMAALYHLAASRSDLVVGTGNRTEILIGYFTKWGDGAADILPIAALYKHEVLELARALRIPARIIEKPPSAGLWSGQTDEGEIGITYDQLDRALTAIDTGAKDESLPVELVERVRGMMASTAHKRALPEAFHIAGR